MSDIEAREYAPTTENIRQTFAYVQAGLDHDDGYPFVTHIRVEEFDRWLAAHDAEVAAKSEQSPIDNESLILWRVQHEDIGQDCDGTYLLPEEYVLAPHEDEAWNRSNPEIPESNQIGVYSCRPATEDEAAQWLAHLSTQEAGTVVEAPSINESNWGRFAAVVLEAEAAHWEAEYESLTRKHGSTGLKKIRAAWKLGATMLNRRAERYREHDVRLTIVTDATNGAPNA